MTGVIFAICFVSGSLMLGEFFGGFADSDQFFVDYYASDAHHVRDLAGGHLMIVAALVLLLFFGLLIRLLRSRLGTAVELDMAQSSSVVGVVLLLAGVAATITVTFAQAFGRLSGDGPLTSPAVALAPQLGYVLVMLPAMWAIALAIALILWSGWSARFWPGWLRWLSVAAAVLLPLSAAGFMPVVLLPVWALAVSIWAWHASPSVLPAGDSPAV